MEFEYNKGSFAWNKGFRGLKMSEKEKKKNITLSVTKDTDEKISEMSKKFGMTKSGLITFLVQQANEKGIFR